MIDNDDQANEVRALRADPPQKPEVEHGDAVLGDVMFDRLGFIEYMVNESLAI